MPAWVLPHLLLQFFKDPREARRLSGKYLGGQISSKRGIAKLLHAIGELGRRLLEAREVEVSLALLKTVYGLRVQSNYARQLALLFEASNLARAVYQDGNTYIVKPQVDEPLDTRVLNHLSKVAVGSTVLRVGLLSNPTTVHLVASLYTGGAPLVGRSGSVQTPFYRFYNTLVSFLQDRWLCMLRPCIGRDAYFALQPRKDNQITKHGVLRSFYALSDAALPIIGAVLAGLVVLTADRAASLNTELPKSYEDFLSECWGTSPKEAAKAVDGVVTAILNERDYIEPLGVLNTPQARATYILLNSLLRR